MKELQTKKSPHGVEQPTGENNTHIVRYLRCVANTKNELPQPFVATAVAATITANYDNVTHLWNVPSISANRLVDTSQHVWIIKFINSTVWTFFLFFFLNSNFWDASQYQPSQNKCTRRGEWDGLVLKRIRFAVAVSELELVKCMSVECVDVVARERMSYVSVFFFLLFQNTFHHCTLCTGTPVNNMLTYNWTRAALSTHM